MIQYDKLKKALKHLSLQYNNYTTLDESVSTLMKEAVAESVIQRFETCYDCLWKVLKKYLEFELGLPEVPNSPKPILRIACENGLFHLPETQVIAYANARIGTSHDYSGEKAKEALTLMDAYIKEAIALYETMSGESWND
jgi:nucleotidyltransferase substrate binding protein (TIGR01987 family)